MLESMLRDGSPTEIQEAEVHPGDILIVGAGDRVDADTRPIGVEELRLDESTLTGQSVLIAKTLEVGDQKHSIGRAKMVRMCTIVSAGTGRTVVVGKNTQTEMGRIAAEVRATGREETALLKHMHKVGTSLENEGVAFPPPCLATRNVGRLRFNLDACVSSIVAFRKT